MFDNVTTFSEHYKRHNCCSCTFLHSLPLPLSPLNDQVSSSAPSLGNKQTAYSHSTYTKAELKSRGIRHHSSGDEQYSLLESDAVSLGEYFPTFRRTVAVRSFERSQITGLKTQPYLLNLTNPSSRWTDRWLYLPIQTRSHLRGFPIIQCHVMGEQPLEAFPLERPHMSRERSKLQLIRAMCWNCPTGRVFVAAC